MGFDREVFEISMVRTDEKGIIFDVEVCYQVIEKSVNDLTKFVHMPVIPSVPGVISKIIFKYRDVTFPQITLENDRRFLRGYSRHLGAKLLPPAIVCDLCCKCLFLMHMQ